MKTNRFCSQPYWLWWLDKPVEIAQQAKADATHLAVASAHRVDYLLTWNMKHLANVEMLRQLRPIAESHGHRMPVVCTPLQLMGEIKYED